MQKVLPLKLRPSLKRHDFIIGRSNKEAIRWIDKYPNWKQEGLIIIGPKFSGKSHLVSVLQLKSNMQLKNADDNRSYTANILTDVIAFIGAGWIILRGYALDEGIIGFIGSAIFTIHLMQLIYKRGIPNIPF